MSANTQQPLPQRSNIHPVEEIQEEAASTEELATQFEDYADKFKDTEKPMIKMIKALSKSRPIELTIYKFKIFPPIMEESEA